MASLLLLLLALGGCAVRQDDVLRYGKTREPIDPSQVIFYEQPPAGGYQAVARVKATTVRAFGDRQEALDAAREELRRQAAELGANGILLDGPLARSADTDDIFATEVEALAISVGTAAGNSP